MGIEGWIEKELDGERGKDGRELMESEGEWEGEDGGECECVSETSGWSSDGP